MNEEPGARISPKQLAWMLPPGTEVALIMKTHNGKVRRRSRIVTSSNSERIVMMVEKDGDSIISFIDSDMRIYLTDNGFILRSGGVESRYVIVRSGESAL